MCNFATPTGHALDIEAWERQPAKVLKKKR